MPSLSGKGVGSHDKCGEVGSGGGSGNSLQDKADCVWERKAKGSGLSWLSARKPRVHVPRGGEVCIIVGGAVGWG